ncbi:MAG: efflux RND transporter periplasmic adaptor subunit, partial [Janthinobacterium lividum]
VVTVQPQSVAVNTELPGRTTSYRVAEVRARVDGIVLKRNFVEGSDVKEGQILYQIDPAPYQAALASAKATLAKAQSSLVSSRAQAGRYKTLVAANAVSKQSYDDAVASQGQGQADVSAGQAGVQTAQINLGYTTVRSPITGRIGRATVTEGAYVQASAATLLATVQQITPLYVDLTQPSDALLRMRRNLATGTLQSAGQNGAKVQLVLDDGTVMPDVGQLAFTDVSVDQSTGTTTVRAIFPNTQRTLLPGMFVRARIQEATNDHAMLVPMQGITRDQKGAPTALVVGADNKVVLRSLTTAQTEGNKWVVTSGLNPGDRVIVEGTQKAKPGQVVSPVAANLPGANNSSAGGNGADGGNDGAATMAASGAGATPGATAATPGAASGTAQ